MKSGKHTLFAVSFTALFLHVLSAPLDEGKIQFCETEACKSAAQSFKDYIDASIDPCDDFYLHACGNWPKLHKNNQFASSLQNNVLGLRNKENTEEILEFLRKSNSDDEPEAVHKARKLFSLCLNNDTYSNDVSSIEKILREIGITDLPFLTKEIQDFDYTTVLAKATKFGIKIFFSLGVTQNPYDRKVNVIALTKPAISLLDPDIMPLQRYQNIKKREIKSVSSEEQMSKVMVKMCENSRTEKSLCQIWNGRYNYQKDLLIDKINRQNSERMLTIMKPRSRLNSSQLYTTYTLQELQELTDNIANETNSKILPLNWTRYVQEIFTGIENVTLDLNDPTKIKIIVEEIDAIRDLIKYMYKIPSKEIELGIWWNVISTLLPYVDSQMMDTKSDSREKACAGIVTSSFGMAVSYMYSTKNKYINAKIEIRKMFEYIRESMKEIIENSSWIDKKTKERSLLKLTRMKSYIAYPNSMKSPSLNEFYNEANISDNFLNTMVSKIQNQIKKHLSILNQINDLDEDSWILTPNIVNAFYDPTKNTLVIPAGILGTSIYNDNLAALNYGAIGAIMGHELTHGFDNMGRRFNEIGNLEDWWQEETLDIYRTKAKCFVKTYDTYNVTINKITQKVNSSATLGEDISDNGGFKESLFAYRKYLSEIGKELFLPQFGNFSHEQLLTLAFANLWCENPSSLSPYLNAYMDHSPNGVRVNGVLKNSNEFSEIWKCPKGSNMNPIEKCSVW